MASTKSPKSLTPARSKSHERTMKTYPKSRSPRPSLWKIALLLFALSNLLSARAGVVYENQNEFFTAADFNGDGILDVLILDKNTGNARVGYQDALGNLSWSAP